jgi:hypothetical protein
MTHEALKRLVELDDAASALGADPDTRAWDDAITAARVALLAHELGLDEKPVNAAAVRLLQQLELRRTDPDAPLTLERAESELRAALAAQPPAPAPASDGEREKLAAWLDGEAQSCAIQFKDRILRAATLLRAPAPAAVPVGERPWEREGWCDVEGRCWWFNRAGIPEWQLADGGPYGDFCLPHWAIPDPQSPQGGEVAE